MSKPKKMMFVIGCLVVIIILSVWRLQAQAIELISFRNVERDNIEELIDLYFKKRYQIHTTLELENFGDLIANSSQGDYS